MPQSAKTHSRSKTTTQGVWQQNRNEERRGLLNSRRWRKYRKAFLSRPENALCAECKRVGRIKAAEAIDHIKAWRSGKIEAERQQLFWNPANHQPICIPCNSRKACHFEHGFGNVPKKS